jgi:hypothetical protein
MPITNEGMDILAFRRRPVSTLPFDADPSGAAVTAASEPAPLRDASAASTPVSSAERYRTAGGGITVSGADFSRSPRICDVCAQIPRFAT